MTTKPDSKKLLRKTARRLDFMRRFGLINQGNGSVNNNLSRFFCGRCFGAVLHEMLLPDTENVKYFNYHSGIRLFEEFLYRNSGHYRKHRSSDWYDVRLARYLREFCGAPAACFSGRTWMDVTTPGNVIRKAIEFLD